MEYEMPKISKCPNLARPGNKRRTDATKIYLSLLFDEEKIKFGPNYRPVGKVEYLSIGNCTLTVCLYMRMNYS